MSIQQIEATIATRFNVELATAVDVTFLGYPAAEFSVSGTPADVARVAEWVRANMGRVVTVDALDPDDADFACAYVAPERTPAHVISSRVLALVASGMSAREALSEVVGRERIDAMIDAVYDTLRARQVGA